MKKVMLTAVGGTLVFAGLIFLIVPGPAFLLIIPGLALLSLEYPVAKKWLKRTQKTAKKSAVWLDSVLLKRKYSK